jgi:hypothetical protein
MGDYLRLDNWAQSRVGIRPSKQPGPRSVAVPAAHLGDRGVDRRYLDVRIARLMGTSIAMIDRHYGHLARD